jgi:hypothetical protein
MSLASGEQGSWGTLVWAGDQHRLKSGDSTFQLGRFIHLAAVWDGSDLRLFVNGKESLKNPAAVVKPTAHQGITIVGAGYGGVRMFYFQGEIDELRVSNSARYSRDFTPASRFEPDHETLALYHFDEGSGDKLTDFSSHGHYGRIVGAKWLPRVEATTPVAAGAR